MTSRTSSRLPWMVSLHGGHSGEFCDHAQGALEEILEAAVAAGYTTFGVSEHAPRVEDRFLYSEERKMGWTVPKLERDFAAYIQTVRTLSRKFEDRLTVLRGFEAEVVPTADYERLMRAYRRQLLPDGSPAFDYTVGSVHYVNELQIDGSATNFRRAADAAGGIEALAVQYYRAVAAMTTALRPEVVGHLDLIKKNVEAAGYRRADVEGTTARKAAESALEAIISAGSILDLNTAGWRKGLGEPYPGPWLVEQAHKMGAVFCFGDDSHRPSDVGQRIGDARLYLLNLNVRSITTLSTAAGTLNRVQVGLE
ncbi:MAG TPA: histidinol-phosphatase [Chthonomonadales bacterium]|nr:histidinol-phosphatase [Chthonomonadales bacterium]